MPQESAGGCLLYLLMHCTGRQRRDDQKRPERPMQKGFF